MSPTVASEKSVTTEGEDEDRDFPAFLSTEIVRRTEAVCGMFKDKVSLNQSSYTVNTKSMISKTMNKRIGLLFRDFSTIFFWLFG